MVLYSVVYCVALSAKLQCHWNFSIKNVGERKNRSRNPLPNHCYDCPDIKCFARKNREHLKTLAVKKPQAKYNNGKAISQEGHFYPQSWFCCFSRHQDQFDIIRYSRSPRFYREFIDYLKRQGVPESTLRILAETMPGTTVRHETSFEGETDQTDLFRSWNPARYRRGIYYDFAMFGFDLAES